MITPTIWFTVLTINAIVMITACLIVANGE